MRYQDVIDRERAADEALAALKAEIVDAVRLCNPPDGVCYVKGPGIPCATVAMSAVLKNGFNLSARTYLPESQAEAVKRRISNGSRTYELLDRLREMTTTECISFGCGDTVKLNQETLMALQGYLE